MDDSEPLARIEEEYFDMKDRNRREYVSQWYESINEGRYFLFFKENDISSKQSIDQAPTGSSICTASIDGCRAQMLQDFLTIDGSGLGRKPGNHIEHIDDMFL